PSQFDDVHQAVKINRLNGKLANSSTPPDNVETKIFTVLHSEMPNNPDWEIPVQAWALASGYSYPPTEQDDGSVIINNGFSVDFVTPTNNQTITAFPINVQVNVNGTIAPSVDLYMDGTKVGTKITLPYSFQIPQTANGNHSLT